MDSLLNKLHILAIEFLHTLLIKLHAPFAKYIIIAEPKFHCYKKYDFSTVIIYF